MDAKAEAYQEELRKDLKINETEAAASQKKIEASVEGLSREFEGRFGRGRGECL
jgi:hypothetical protein